MIQEPSDYVMTESASVSCPGQDLQCVPSSIPSECKSFLLLLIGRKKNAFTGPMATYHAPKVCSSALVKLSRLAQQLQGDYLVVCTVVLQQLSGDFLVLQDLAIAACPLLCAFCSLSVCYGNAS